MHLTLLPLFLGCLAVTSCSRAESTPPPAAPRLRLAAATPGPEAAPLIAEARARSLAEHRRLLVYVGAAWCEPCRYFHDAAAKGALDAQFGTLDLLEFDADRDRERLAAAGYRSDLIPLLALPGPDGRATGRQMEGSTKGPGAVDNMTPRLKALLEQAP